MKKTNLYLSAIFIIGLLAISCSSDEAGPEGKGGTFKYVIASSPIASEGVADYLLTVDDLTTGTVSTIGNGIEQDGTYRYYVTHNNKFFSMLYGQGNPGAVTTYELDDTGNLSKLSDFQSETVQAFAPVEDDILMMKIPRSGAAEALWFRLDTDLIEIVDDGQVNVEDVASNGERAHFTWLTQVGDKVFAPYMSIKGCCSDVFGTAYADSAWIAVFSYPEMELEKVIKDNRTSYIGRYFNSGLAVDEIGDVYAYSASVAVNNGDFTATKPSAIVRIKAGNTEFDQTYLFDIEEASEGYYANSMLYLGQGNMLLTMAKEKNSYSLGPYMAITNVYNKTFTWITGLPEATAITKMTSNNLALGDGKTAYVGVTTDDGSYVYEIDASAATATKGLKIEGGIITAISVLQRAE